MNQLEDVRLTIGELPAIRPGEPMLHLSLNGRVLRLPVSWAYRYLYAFIPPWLRDSTAPLPKTGDDDEKQGRLVLELIRSGIKNLLRPFLPMIMRMAYGKDAATWPEGVHLPRGRDDVLPIIIRLLMDVCIAKAFYHPLSVEYDDATGLVTGFRLGNLLAAHTGDAPGAPGARGDGSQATSQS